MHVEKLVFVLQTRTMQSRQTEHPLTDQERVEGWVDGSEHDFCRYKDRQCNEGHGLGSLHSMPAGQILTWRPKPGDRILAALKVDFSGTYHPATPEAEGDCGTTEWVELTHARVDREISGPMPDYHRRFVFCDSVLGQDELRRTLECALKGDWRSVQCAYRLEDLPKEVEHGLTEAVVLAAIRASEPEEFDKDQKEWWRKRRAFAEIEVQKQEAQA